ncbi:HAD family hydrolase [Streptomyces sparsogenes]|uniref:HAD family hydrolase n=1 Tax=Streptomyces sparsogenes TaxID=67365 RepID=UPI0033ED72B2
MTIKYVVFDWAGTLTPWHTVDLAGIWLETAREIDPDGAPDLAQRLLRAERDLMTRCRDTQCSGTLDEVFRAAGVVPDGAAIATYRRAWEEHTFLDPEGAELLRTLRERDLGVGVLSNTLWSADWHHEIFERDGVHDFIDAAVYSSEVPWTKPNPLIFELIAERLGAEDPGACAFVGDRLFEDIWGARQARMRTIWVPHSEIPEEELGSDSAVPDATAHTLKDVLTVLDSWASRHPSR